MNEYIFQNIKSKLVNGVQLCQTKYSFQQRKKCMLPVDSSMTFIINLILAKYGFRESQLCQQRRQVVAGGRTAHSTFKLHLIVSLQNDSVCCIRKNCPLGKVLKYVSLIIWEECTMIYRANIEVLDRTLRVLEAVITSWVVLLLCWQGTFGKLYR